MQVLEGFKISCFAELATNLANALSERPNGTWELINNHSGVVYNPAHQRRKVPPIAVPALALSIISRK